MTAAVVGVIANLALWFGLHVLFGEVGRVAFGPVALPVPALAQFDLAAALSPARRRSRSFAFTPALLWVLALAALAGLAVRLFA